MPATREARTLINTSVVLQQLHDEMPSDHVTLGWLMSRLHKRSYGMIMLLLALIAMVPGICIVAGLLIMIPAFEMIAGKPAPQFPHRIAKHPLPTRHFAAFLRRAMPVLSYLEKLTHPRWSGIVEVSKPLVGIIVVILGSIVVFAPIPLVNVVPALVIALISLAYLEEDGLLLLIGLLAAIVVLTIAATAVWETVLGVKWLSSL